jgi:hypothetical protein
MLIYGLSNTYQQVDVFCSQLALLMLSSAFERETLWDLSNRVFDRYFPSAPPTVSTAHLSKMGAPDQNTGCRC